ncbi:MAG: hypothetical protein M1839_008120 [Geoglossum umbratile]|nr:MAG: hypothetical protein M1839_008120 [Geoglossum umbratile]
MTSPGEPSLASLSVSHVYYNPHDRISLVCALLALVPQALCVSYVTLIWSTREIEILLMFAGQMGCEAVNWGLKRLIKEERPKLMKIKGYGMPSSHAQFVAYFSVSLALFLLVRHQPNPSTTRTPLSFSIRAIVSILAVASACVVATSRIYLSYHTPKQVLVGFVAGIAFAFVWFMFTSALRSSGILHNILDTELLRMGRWRDLVVEEDLQDSGWEKWEAGRLRRAAFMGSYSENPVNGIQQKKKRR